MVTQKKAKESQDMAQSKEYTISTRIQEVYKLLAKMQLISTWL